MKVEAKAVAKVNRSIPSSDPVYGALLDFFHYEARLLDNRCFEEWADCLDESMIYAMPFRQTLAADAESMFGAVEGGIFDETKATLLRRFDIAVKPSAWGEAPPARTRRFLSNLAVERTDGGVLSSRVNVLLTSFREGALSPDIIVAERQDLVAPLGSSFKILKRLVLVDNGALPSRGLTMPF